MITVQSVNVSSDSNLVKSCSQYSKETEIGTTEDNVLGIWHPLHERMAREKL